jgi:hypothetical protein
LIPQACEKVQAFGIKVGISDLEDIVEGMNLPIKSLPEENMKQLVVETIQGIAVSYCGAVIEKSENFLWRECVRLIKRDFNFIGVMELITAFRLAASRKINADLTAYGGIFNVNMLGSVLTAYVDYRAKAVTALVQAKREEELKAQEELSREKSMKVNSEWVEKFNHAISEKESDHPDFMSWEEIPFPFAEFISKNSGLINLPDDRKAQLWKLAQALAKAEAIAKQDEQKWEGRAERFAMRSVLGEIRKGVLPKLLTSRAHINYCKLFVWEFIKPDGTEVEYPARIKELEEEK